MVSFRIIASALALAAPIVAQTSAQLVSTLNTLTTKSRDLQRPAQSISLVNGPLLVIGQGPLPQIIIGLQDFITTASAAITSQQQDPATVAAGAGSDAVVTAYKTFVREHTTLLNILEGKAQLFKTVPFIGAPMAAILRQDEAVLDSLIISLTQEVPSRVADFTADGSNLVKLARTAFVAYEGVQTGQVVKRSMRFGRREVAVAA